jgi:WD40 repeat protein
MPGMLARRHSGAVTCLAICNFTGLAASGGEDAIVNIFRVDSVQPVGQIRDAAGSIMSLCFSPSGDMLLAASHDKSVRFYRGTDRFSLCHYNCKDNRDVVYDAKFLSDDRFVSLCRDRTIKVFDLQKMVAISSSLSASIPCSLCSLTTGQVLTGHYDGQVRCWDMRMKDAAFALPAHRARIIQVLGSPMGTAISLGLDGCIVGSDARAQAVVGKIRLGAKIPQEKAEMAVVDQLATIGLGTAGELYVYDIDAFKLKERRAAHKAPVCCVATRGHSGMLTGDKAGCVKFWMQ